MKSLRLNSALQGLIVGTGAHVLISFLRNYLLARVIDVDQYGLLVISNNYIELFSLIFNLGVANALIRYSKEKYEKDLLNIYLNNIFHFSLIILLVELAILLPLYKFFSSLLLNEVNLIFYFFILINFPLVGLIKLIYSLYWGFGNFWSRSLVILLPLISQLIPLFIIYYLNYDIEIINILLMIIVGNIVVVVLFLRGIRKEFELKYLKPTFSSIKIGVLTVRKDLKFGVLGLLSSLGLILINSFNQSSIINYVNSIALGKYSVLLSIAIYLYMPIQMIGNFIQSQYIEYYKAKPDFVISKLAKVNLISALYILVAGIITSFYLYDIVVFMFGIKYTGVEYVYKFLIVGLLFNTSYVITGSLSPIIEKNHITTIAIIIGLVICVIANLYLVPILGLKGAAISYLTTNLTVSLVQTALFLKNGIQLKLYPMLIMMFFSILLIII